MSKEAKLQKAKDYAISCGGVCLSSEYVDNKTKLEWKCSNHAHESWFSNSDNVINKETWCVKCSGKAPKPSEEGLKIAQDYAQKLGGKCLSTEYIARRKNLEWKCLNPEHKSWQATSDNVVYKGSWCKECANESLQTRKDSSGLEKAKAYAASRGGECLSTKYVNQETKLEWKCSNPNHESWFAIAKIIRNNSWCKCCHDETKVKKGEVNHLALKDGALRT